MTDTEKAALERRIDELCAEVEAEKQRNAKLRALVSDMWFWGYCGHMDSESQEWQMKHIEEVLHRMHELGAEVKYEPVQGDD